MAGDRWRVIDRLYHKNKSARDAQGGWFYCKIIRLIWLKVLTYNTHIAIIHIMIKQKANQNKPIKKRMQIMLKMKTYNVTALEDSELLFRTTYTEKDMAVSVTIKKDKVSGTAYFSLDSTNPVSIRYSADLDGAGMLTECESVVEYSLDVWVVYEHEQQMRMSATKNGATYKMTQEEREFYQKELIGVIYSSIYDMIEKVESEENKKLGNENGLPCYNPDFNLDYKEDDFIVFKNTAVFD